MKRPFESRSLIATKNALRLNPVIANYVSAANANVQYSSSSQTWGFSIMFCITSFASGTIVDIITRRNNALPQNDGAGFLLRATKGVGDFFSLDFLAEGNGSLPLSKAVGANLLTNNWYRISITIEAYDGANVYINTRINDSITLRSVFYAGTYTITSSQPLFIGSGFYPGFNLGVDGLISNVIFWNDIPTEEQLSYMHNMNIVPQSFHSKITGHYPLNQSSGVTAFDVVEMYNYSKVTPLSRVNGTLMNYSDLDGHTNPIISEVWQNVYQKNRIGEYFWKGNNTSSYAECINFTSQTYPAFSIFFAFVSPDDSQYGSFPNNQSNIFANDNFGDPNFVSVRTGLGTGNYEVLFAGGSGISGGPASPGNYSFGVITYDGVTIKIFTNSAGPSNSFAVAGLGLFDNMTFTKEISKVANGISRFVLIDKVVTSSEMQLLFQINRGDNKSYKSISTIQIDLNFGDIYLNAGNYYARDSSGNNRHAQIYSWTPATDQPLLIEQSSLLPTRKALRFTSSSSQYLTVSGFVPTSEKGYTTIIGMCLDSNRLFDAGYGDCFLSKRDSSNGKLKIIFGDAGTRTIRKISTSAGFFNNDMVVMNTDTSKPHIITIATIANSISLPNDGKAFIDGSLTRSDFNGLDVPEDYSNIDGDLCIGRDDGVSRFLNGYIFFIAIWKGYLSDLDIKKIANNSLGDNAKGLMADCQLYLNFEQIINDSGVYKIKDWSPQNHTVVLNNYTLAEITPTNPAYKLVDLDTLR